MPDPEVRGAEQPAAARGLAVTERSWLDHLPFAVELREFEARATGLGPQGACCVFVVERSIPRRARGGYACLVIAFARADEPVTIFEDGSAALLIRSGGTAAAHVVAERVLHQAARLHLERTLRAGIHGLADLTVTVAIDHARRAAHAAPIGGIADAR